MLSILIVWPAGGDSDELPEPRPSVEILRAHGAQDAVEKLGRNRRIDAVVLAAGQENGAIAEAIRLDNPAPPPLFAVGGENATVPGARNLAPAGLSSLFDQIILELS